MKRERLSEELYDALRDSIEVGSTIPTLSTGKPNRITGIAPEGVYVVTEKSEREGKPPQLVDAWMLEAGWSYLQSNGSITNEFLLSGDGLNVKRSSVVCALLARLPGVAVVSRRAPILLELLR